MKKHIICLIKILCICPKLAFAQPWLGPRLDKNTSACYEGRTMDFLMRTGGNINLEISTTIFDPRQQFDPFCNQIYKSKQEYLDTIQMALAKAQSENNSSHRTLLILQKLVKILPED